MEKKYRQLSAEEILILQSNGNYSADWSQIKVCDPFICDNIRNNYFSGSVLIGAISNAMHIDAGLSLLEGITNSRIESSIIGNHCAIHNVHFLSNFKIGEHSLIFNVDEMTACSNSLEYIEPMNECGGRKIRPFNGMTIGDAYLWAKYRDHKNLIDQLDEFTTYSLSSDEGRVGVVGAYCVIKNCRTLHNLAINSSQECPSRIVDCVVVSDGIVGYGCHLEYGCIAFRFLLGENVKLEKGVRLNDTVVGDNSTIACCEVGNNIIFPAHEQHHNNSFLIASVIKGQSNIAAGATIGSNHNGRTSDNELVAGRGFWPGLCSSFKHSSRFASYCLLAKADYPNELDIKLPFALVNNNLTQDCLEVMPAYWWMYNMYALNRNEHKFEVRDKRFYKYQHIEFSPFAPDIAEEIIEGCRLLQQWIDKSNNDIVIATGLEKGKRKTVILKSKEAMVAYHEMLVYYSMQTLTNNGKSMNLPNLTLGYRETRWINLGGQLISGTDFDQLISDIETNELKSWNDIHNRYSQLWAEYPKAKQQHAYAILCELLHKTSIALDDWKTFLSQYEMLRRKVSDEIVKTRHKDEINPFRQMTYDNLDEMNAVLG